MTVKIPPKKQKAQHKMFQCSQAESHRDILSMAGLIAFSALPEHHLSKKSVTVSRSVDFHKMFSLMFSFA